MKFLRLLLICSVGLIAISCQEKPTDHPVFKYFPSSSRFEEGFVSKYYYHYYPDNPDQSAATEIGYTKYIKLGENRYKGINYNAGFEWQSERLYKVVGDSLQVESGIDLNRSTLIDTTEIDLIDNTLSVWGGQMRSPYRERIVFNDSEYTYSYWQRSVTDTTILEKPSIAFLAEWSYREVGSDSVVNKGSTRSYYVQGLGFYGSKSKVQSFSQHMELVEQMSLQEFENRANHEEHRIAYIDPADALSDDTEFTLCSHIKRVADYYNSTPDGRYIHGKKALLDTVYSNLDQAKLFSQSGRLVFRFIVNCNGEAGRFIAEGFDLNYQKVRFNEETVTHLFGILQRLQEWRPVVINEEPRDAYFYITFNIENGKIVDILP